MDIIGDRQPMAIFRDNTDAFIDHVRLTRRPLTLTVDGRPAAVLQDADAYQNLLDLAAEASGPEGIRQGLEDLEAGRTRPASEVFDAFRVEHDLPR